MPSPTTSSVTPQDVARLVSEVINRIRAEGRAAAESASAPAALATVTLTDRVISAEILEKLPARTTTVQLARRAVITPSARDVARDRGISLIPAAAQPAGTSGRPLVIARADCATDVSALAARISRAVPQSQQLPAAGLTAALATLADHAGRDAARGLLLTGSPAVACVAANRYRSLRAVTDDTATGLKAAAAACAANLLIIDPSRFSALSLERLAAAFATSNTTVPPAVLTAAAPTSTPAACSCRHSH